MTYSSMIENGDLCRFHFKPFLVMLDLIHVIFCNAFVYLISGLIHYVTLYKVLQHYLRDKQLYASSEHSILKKNYYICYR